MLFQLMDHIAQIDSTGQQIYINKELHEFAEIRTSDDLIAYVDLHRLPDRKLYLFIDEVQDIEAFENALRSFQASGGIDIYCTGSNAKMLSGELATYLSGRYVEIKIYSLTYPEFLEFHGLERKEIDFVCERGSERIYIQVAYLIPTDEVHQREFGNLLVIPDNFPKFVLSMDEIVGGSHEGIQHVHVEEFLFSTLWQ